MEVIKQIMDSLSPEELGRLFPIEIVAANHKWAELFEKEKRTIIAALGEQIAMRVEHFGSTAVPNLAAKPTIDILIEIPDTPELKDHIIEKMKSINYHFIWRTDVEPPYMNFVKGYSPNGITEQTYHVHIAPQSHPLWDRLYFRDYLKQHPETAKEYEQLKYQLAEKHKYNREDYTNAKSEFVKRITSIAKGRYKG